MTAADRYAAWLPHRIFAVRESPLNCERCVISEIEFQTRWFLGEFGKSFLTVSGDPVEIVQFGEWNRESGPDFRGAAVSIKGARPVRGCIELDLDVRDWERHQHAVNPAYENVILHVFLTEGRKRLFTQTLSGREVPQVKVDVTNIDRIAPNKVPLAHCGRCSGAFLTMENEKIADFLASAAHYRMRRKARRMMQTVELHGEFGALFQFLAETLGYKSNKLPFLLLAQRLPVAELRKFRGDLEAVLFGVAGFLDATDLNEYPGDTKNYLRQLWENWWVHRSRLDKLILAFGIWRCGGVRPMNHPHRRLGALAEITRQWPKVREVLHSADPTKVSRFFGALRHEYWDFHYTLSSKASSRRMALVGPERVNGILMNVVLPLAWYDRPSEFQKLRALAAPDFNLRVKTAALRCFGREAFRIPLLKTAIYQQGLLQLYDDFCCRDLSGCAQCPLPEQLTQWR